MLAVVEIGKKQYVVKPGDILDVQKLKTQEQQLVFENVLLLADGAKVLIGTPYVEKAKVKAQNLGERKSKKVIVYKVKRRKKYRKTQGHRQTYTRLKISDITPHSRKTAPKK